MADKTIDSESIILNYNMWGAPRPNMGIPEDGFTGASHHNTATAVYDLGTVIQVYNSTLGVAGFSQFAYLRFEATSGPTAWVAKDVCVQDVTVYPFLVTADPDSALLAASKVGALRPAVLLSTMTDAYYGWFWVGGVVPEDYVAGLGGTYATDDSVVVGPIMVQDLTDDTMGFGVFDEGGTPPNVACGRSDAADA